jgi:hypothetical protein
VVAVGIVAIALAAAALAVTSRPEFCATCHIMKPRYVSWERSTHGRVRADCLDCHAQPGVWGEIKAHLEGTRYLYVLVTGREQIILEARVPDGTCSQCHPLDELPSTFEGVNIAHRNHLSADVPCERCHADFHDNLQGGSLEANLEVCGDCHGPSILSGREGTRREPR